jgi:hypothetical protein
MNEFRHPGFDPSLMREINQPSILLSELEAGSRIQLELMEYDELQYSLTLQVLEQNQTISRVIFQVVGGDVPEAVIERNRRADYNNPELIEAECIIEGSFTHRHGYSRPMTMFHAGYLTAGRSASIFFVTPENRETGNHYMPFVLSFAAST